MINHLRLDEQINMLIFVMIGQGSQRTSQAQTVDPALQIHGPLTRLLKRLKVEGLRMILEEMLFSTQSLEGIYSRVRDTLWYHHFDIFTRPKAYISPSRFMSSILRIVR